MKPINIEASNSKIVYDENDFIAIFVVKIKTCYSNWSLRGFHIWLTLPYSSAIEGAMVLIIQKVVKK